MRFSVWKSADGVPTSSLETDFNARSTLEDVCFGARRPAEGVLKSSLETSFDARSTPEDMRFGAWEPAEGVLKSSMGPAATLTGVDALLGALRFLDVNLPG